MFGSRSVLAGFTLGCLAGFASIARADEDVPGGWSPQVGFQSFQSPGYDTGFRTGNDGVPGLGRDARFGGVSLFPAGQSFPNAYQTAAQPQTVNGLVPFSDVVRRQGRKRNRR